MSHFVLMFWRDKPVDWLLDDMMNSKVCTPEKDVQHCENEKLKLKRFFKPAQFQHIGHFSSLKGKTQDLKEKI